MEAVVTDKVIQAFLFTFHSKNIMEDVSSDIAHGILLDFLFSSLDSVQTLTPTMHLFSPGV